MFWDWVSIWRSLNSNKWWSPSEAATHVWTCTCIKIGLRRNIVPWRARPPSLQHSLLLIFFVCNRCDTILCSRRAPANKGSYAKIFFCYFLFFYQIELRVYVTFLTRVYMSSVIVMIVGILGGAWPTFTRFLANKDESLWGSIIRMVKWVVEFLTRGTELPRFFSKNECLATLLYFKLGLILENKVCTSKLKVSKQFTETIN